MTIALPQVDEKLLDDAEASQMAELMALSRECRKLRKQRDRLLEAIPGAVSSLRRARATIEAELGQHLPVMNRAAIVVQNAIQELEEYLL